MPGYDIERFANISPTQKAELTCVICQDVLRCPLVADCCLQAFCEDCINEWLRNSNSCPYDRASLTVSQLTSPPRLVLNMIAKLQIKCEFRENGCREVVLLEDLNAHQLSCISNPENKICKKCFTENLNSGHDCVKSLLKLNEKLTVDLDKFKSDRKTDVETMHAISSSKRSSQEPTNSTVNTTLTAPSFRDILREARKHLSTPNIIQIDMKDELKTRIISMVGEIVGKHNNMLIVCKTITDKLEQEFGKVWHCFANYDQSKSKSTCDYSYETGFRVKLQYGKLLLIIFKTQFLDINSTLQRFRSGKIKREISILENFDMSVRMIADLKQITYTALEKCRTLNEIAKEIRTQMDSKHANHWQCFIYAYFGTFSANYTIGDLNITVYQAVV